LVGSFKRPVQLDRSLEGQYALIEKTFSDLEKSDLKTLKHPNKPGLTAVEVSSLDRVSFTPPPLLLCARS